MNAADPNMESETPLHLAAKLGNVDFTHHILSANPDDVMWGPCIRQIDKPNMMGRTALHLAAEKGSIEVCKLLLAAGASPLAITNDGFTPVGCAVITGNIDMVKLLVSMGAFLEAPMPGTCGALELALIHNKMAIADYLWRHGADLEAEDPDRGFSTLIYRMAQAGHTTAVKFLIEKLVDPSVWNAPGHDGVSPVVAAVTRGHFKALREMLEHTGMLDDIPGWAPGGLKVVRCNIQIRAKALMDIVRTPLLFFNASNDRVDAALIAGIMLLDRDKVLKALKDGANPNVVSTADNSMLMLLADRAQSLSYKNEEDQRKIAQILEDLVAAGADMNRTYPPRRLTFLSQLISTGKPALVRKALSLGAIVNISDSFGRRPLHRAVEVTPENPSDALEMMKDLISAGADIEAFNKEGYTPLQSAILNQQSLDKIRLLLNAGANPELKCMAGVSIETMLTHKVPSQLRDETLLLIQSARAQRKLKNIFSRKNPMSGAARMFAATGKGQKKPHRVKVGKKK